MLRTADAASATGVWPRSTRAGYSGLSRWLLGLGVVLLVGVVDVVKGAEESRLAGEMVTIPGGTFRMGDLSGVGGASELPVHRVTVASLRVGQIRGDVCAVGRLCYGRRGCSHNPQDFDFGRGNRPVIDVSWDHVQEFIAWLNENTSSKDFRLPTESEWEYAARAKSVSEFSWGDVPGQGQANCNDCGDRWFDGTAPGGSFAANAWGLHDMHGNVGEWVQDCVNGSNYEGAPAAGSAAWRSELFLAPEQRARTMAPADGSAAWHGDCSQRVVRGGSWSSNSWNLRSANRYRFNRSDRYSTLGFRLVKDK